MTTAIRSPSNTPIVWVARKVNDFLKDTVHSDRVRKSRRYSDQLVSDEIHRHLVNKHDGLAVVVAPGACFAKNAKCVQGILYFVAEDFVTDFFY